MYVPVCILFYMHVHNVSPGARAVVQKRGSLTVIRGQPLPVSVSCFPEIGKLEILQGSLIRKMLKGILQGCTRMAGYFRGV